MEITVTFRHVPPSDGARQYAIEKVSRLQKFVRKPIQAHVILAVTRNRQSAEVVLSGKDLAISASAETKDMYSAIDKVIDKLDHQLNKAAGKTRRHRRDEAHSRSVSVERSEPEQRIKRQRATMKAMTLDQALARLPKSKTGFVLFVSAETGTVSLVYLRKDGEVGLVETDTEG